VDLEWAEWKVQLHIACDGLWTSCWGGKPRSAGDI